MLKMTIRMDEHKIMAEGKYRLARIYQTIDWIFLKMGFSHAQDLSGLLVYYDTGSANDYGRFGRIVNILKRQSWFMDNVEVWLFCDSDGSDDPNGFDEEDLRAHYKGKQNNGMIR